MGDCGGGACVVGDGVWVRRNLTSSVRSITPRSISVRQQQACCRQRQQVRGEGDGACTHGLTYYNQVVASGAVGGGLLRPVAVEEAAGMRGDVLIRSSVYGTNTTEGEQKQRRGEWCPGEGTSAEEASRVREAGRSNLVCTKLAYIYLLDLDSR